MAKTVSVLILLLSFTFLLAPEGRADENVMCAQVVPCGEDGTVWPEFAVGECAEYYARVCQAKSGDQETASGSTCEKGLAKLSAENKQLRRKLRNAARLAKATR